TLAWTGARRLVVLAIGLLAGVIGAITAMQVSAFMGDVAFIRFAQPPGIEFYHTHYCMTAYAHAAELVRAGVADVYDLALRPPGAVAADVPTAAFMAPFQLDRYGYPPQFLLVPLALSAVIPDFAAQRAVWFGFNGLLFAFALWRVSVWVGPRGGRFAVLGLPIMWYASLPTFQSGNVHLAVMAIAMLGMCAFADRRERLGGALLAIATLAKIGPGLLGVVLLVQRRWRAAGWTVAWAVGLSGLALMVIGWGTFDAFVHTHLPAIASGAAYDFLGADLLSIVTNWSPFSLPFKLEALGVELEPWRWGPRVGTVFTALAFVLAMFGGRRIVDRRSAAVVGLAVLTLASMRSPMAPPYVTTSAFWALLFVVAEPTGAGRWLGLAGMAMLLGLPMWVIALGGSEGFGPAVILGALVAIGLLVVLMAWLLIRRWRPLDAETAADPAVE
ncbi:MAG: DUF2029 domain-containing protein, partial [Myxococcales bacterium]|nr:DUF2029 domain-containing protein [Myxococcales bacterium]